MAVSPLVIFQQQNKLPTHGIIGITTLLKMIEVWEIDKKEQLAHFLGQVAHESGNFTRISENLNYSAPRLLEIFDKYFTPEEARQFAYKPEAIANRTYANRIGNGDEASGDGYLYRGRGAIQLTGKANYQDFSEWVKDFRVMTNPDIVATKYYFECALFYFEQNNLWPFAVNVTKEAIFYLTKKINGGTHGLKDREEKTFKYHRLLSRA
jgi:putative chitinase